MVRIRYKSEVMTIYIMVFNVLKKLESEGRLGQSMIYVSDTMGFSGVRTILGSEVTRVSNRFVEFMGGESLYEKSRVPLEFITEIFLEGRRVFVSKKKIKRIYFRK